MGNSEECLNPKGSKRNVPLFSFFGMKGEGFEYILKRREVK